MIVSRRSYLLSQPSGSLMRAAGAAASGAHLNAVAQKQAAERFAKLTGERAGKAITR